MESNKNLCIDCIHYPDDCTTDYTLITYDNEDNVIDCPDHIPQWWLSGLWKSLIAMVIELDDQ